MNQEKVKAFLEALKTDPKAGSLLQAVPAPETDAERFRAYAEIAKKMGYDVSDAELEAYFAEREQAVREHTKAAEALITKLSVDEMEKVSGGGNEPECEETYKHTENCWYNDGCDNIFNKYKRYVCAHSSSCDEAMFGEYRQPDNWDTYHRPRPGR